MRRSQLEKKDYYDRDENGDPFNASKGRARPAKLPADLPLISYNEIWVWLSTEILKDAWRRGIKCKRVIYGKSQFEPSFWKTDDEENCDWKHMNKNPKNFKKQNYPGPL